jgi:hypothetical protein
MQKSNIDIDVTTHTINLSKLVLEIANKRSHSQSPTFNYANFVFVGSINKQIIKATDHLLTNFHKGTELKETN